MSPRDPSARASTRMLFASIVLAIAGVLVLVNGAFAQPPRRADALLAAQVCWLEASFEHDDCTALTHVLMRRAKRSGWTFARMARTYSAIKSDTPRAQLARSLTAGPLQGWTVATNLEWERLRKHAGAVLAGKVPDVCPSATQWGARDLPRDVRRAVSAIEAGRWRVVRCSRPVANAFYAEVASGRRAP